MGGIQGYQQLQLKIDDGQKMSNKTEKNNPQGIVAFGDGKKTLKRHKNASIFSLENTSKLSIKPLKNGNKI